MSREAITVYGERKDGGKQTRGVETSENKLCRDSRRH